MTEETKETLLSLSVEELYSLLDGVLHSAIEQCPTPEIVQAATILHKEIMELANFDLVKVRSSNPDSKPLTDRLINAMYKVHNPYGDDEEKGN